MSKKAVELKNKLETLRSALEETWQKNQEKHELGLPIEPSMRQPLSSLLVMSPSEYNVWIRDRNVVFNEDYISESRIEWIKRQAHFWKNETNEVFILKDKLELLRKVATNLWHNGAYGDKTLADALFMKTKDYGTWVMNSYRVD